MAATVEMRLHVRPYDTDFMGIVNNSVYARWFEDLRMSLLDDIFPLKDMVKRGGTLILYESRVRHVRPLTMESEPLGRVWMTDVGRTRWKMRFAISDQDILCCEGWQTGCYYDLAHRKPAPFPPEFIENYCAVMQKETDTGQS